jgi:N-methylhydantoinase A
LVYLENNAISQVGPRSSHIAGLEYLSFTAQPAEQLEPSRLERDGAVHLTLISGQTSLAITPTCASNILNLVPPEQSESCRIETVRTGFEKLARQRGLPDAETLAEEILAQAAPKVIKLIEGLCRDYKLDRDVVQLVGGGGGSGAIVPFVSRQMQAPHTILENADVISAIGVALALVRDTIVRTVIDPSEDDIRRIRQEAISSVRQMGASDESIQVFVEVDAKRNLLKATAEGSTEIRQQELRPDALNNKDRTTLIAASIGPSQSPPTIVASADSCQVWAAQRLIRRLWLFTERRTAVRVLDPAGAIRWSSNHADYAASRVADAESAMHQLAERYTRYTDAGATIPRCFTLVGGRIIDLSGLVTLEQVLELLRIELKQLPGEQACVLLVDMA